MLASAEAGSSQARQALRLKRLRLWEDRVQHPPQKGDSYLNRSGNNIEGGVVSLRTYLVDGAHCSKVMSMRHLLQHDASSGRRSAGCSNCRLVSGEVNCSEFRSCTDKSYRRAKKGCDQKKPVCGRCLRLSRRCYGYRRVGESPDEGITAHPLENAPDATDIERLTTLDRSKNVGMETASKAHEDEPRPLSDWSDIVRYFADHELILGLVAACELVTMTTHPVLAPDPEQAAKIYGCALSSTREAIQTGWQIADETVLVVTMLLYIYEVRYGDVDLVVMEMFLLTLRQRFHWPEGGSSSSWIIHVQGIIDLVQARGLKQLQNKIGRAIFRKARDIVVR